jgi:hypothetical protein
LEIHSLLILGTRWEAVGKSVYITSIGFLFVHLFVFRMSKLRSKMFQCFARDSREASTLLHGVHPRSAYSKLHVLPHPNGHRTFTPVTSQPTSFLKKRTWRFTVTDQPKYPGIVKTYWLLPYPPQKLVSFSLEQDIRNHRKTTIGHRIHTGDERGSTATVLSMVQHMDSRACSILLRKCGQVNYLLCAAFLSFEG